MRAQIVVKQYSMYSHKTGEYKVQFVKPAAATVTLIDHTIGAEALMTKLTHAYAGIYDSDTECLYSEEQKDAAFKDIANTKLQTPLEMVQTLWLFQDVTRAFTHQLVRYRIGTSFIQESMRFLGMKKVFKVLITDNADITLPEFPPTHHNDRNPGPFGPVAYSPYEDAAVHAIQSYVDMIDNDVPSEDARGVLPTNILTNVYFRCSLLNVKNIIPQRLCCQAQPGEWQPVLLEMRRQIKMLMGTRIEALLKAPYELGIPCGYRASFDRKCKWQDSN